MTFTELPEDAVLDHEQPGASAAAAASLPANEIVDEAGNHFSVDASGKRRLIVDVTPGSDNRDDPNAGKAAPVAGFTELPDDVPLDQEQAQTAGENLGAGVRNAVESAGGLANTITAPIRAGMSALGVGDVDYEKLAASLADHLGLKRQDGVIGAIEKGATQGLLTAGVAAPLAGVGGAIGTVADALFSTPVADAVSSGAAAGAGEAAKENGAGPIGELAATVVGGGLGAGAAVGIPAAVRRITQSTNPSDLLAAFQRQQVTPMAAQVGGMGARAMNAGAKATLGGIPLAAAAERSIATAKAARDRIAAAMGSVMDDTGAGQAVRRGVQSFIAASGKKADALYEAIPIAGERPAVLTNTQGALADLNAGLKSNPELSHIISDPRLQRIETAVAGKTETHPTGLLDANGAPITREVKVGGALSWQDLKAFRTYIGEKAGQPTIGSDMSQAALKRLYAALSDDMKATAQADGPKSLAAFNRANSFYRGRADRIDNTLKLILGNDYQKSPEAAFAQIDRWAREGGDAARLARTIRSLPEDEAATVRASIFARMGRANPGQQNAAADAFSPASFGTQWAKLDSRAKSVLFPGQQYRQTLDDIAKIAESMKGSEKFANTSGTALAERLGKNLFGATVVGYLLHPTAAISGEGIGYAGGMLLASPRFARWLASTPSKPFGPATLAHVNRLTAIASAEPTIANEVLHLQQRLAEAFTAPPMAAAATDRKDKR